MIVSARGIVRQVGIGLFIGATFSAQLAQFGHLAFGDLAGAEFVFQFDAAFAHEVLQGDARLSRAG